MKAKTLVSRILVGLILVCLGILALTRNTQFIKLLVIVCGLYIVCYSLFSLFSFSSFKAFFDTSASSRILFQISNIAGIVIGLLAVIAPIAWLKTIGIAAAYVVAAYLLFSAFVDIRLYFGLKKTGLDTKNLIVEFLCDLVFALVLILAPLEVGKTILVVVGVILILTGVVIGASAIIAKVKEKKNSGKSDKAEFEAVN